MNFASTPECAGELVRAVRQDLNSMLANLDPLQTDKTSEAPPYSQLVVEYPSRSENYRCYFNRAEGDSEAGVLVGRKGTLSDDVDSYTVIAFPNSEVTEIIKPQSCDSIDLYQNGIRKGVIEPCGWSTFAGQRFVTEWRMFLQGESFGTFGPGGRVTSRGNVIQRNHETTLPLILARQEDHWLWQISLFLIAFVAFPLVMTGFMPWRRKNRNYVLSQQDHTDLTDDELWFYFTVSCYFRFVEYSFDYPDQQT